MYEHFVYHHWSSKQRLTVIKLSPANAITREKLEVYMLAFQVQGESLLLSYILLPIKIIFRISVIESLYKLSDFESNCSIRGERSLLALICFDLVTYYCS